MVGRTLFGFLCVKFMLVATLKAEKKCLPAATYRSLQRGPVVVSGTLVAPGDIWLWVGKTDRKKASCSNWWVTTGSID